MILPFHQPIASTLPETETVKDVAFSIRTDRGTALHLSGAALP